MKIFAIRHGETEWNVQGREMGHLDSPLTPRGAEQACAVAERLRHAQVEHIYASDLGRAIQTAEVIASSCGVPITIEPELRERNMGIFQGLTVAEQRARYPNEREAYERIGFEYVIPEGESARQRLERSVRAMTAIAEAARGNRIVVVTHGGFLTGFFEYVLGIEPGNGWRFRRYNASFNSFEYLESGWRMETWNDVSHLRTETRDDPMFE